MVHKKYLVSAINDKEEPLERSNKDEKFEYFVIQFKI